MGLAAAQMLLEMGRARHQDAGEQMGCQSVAMDPLEWAKESRPPEQKVE